VGSRGGEGRKLLPPTITIEVSYSVRIESTGLEIEAEEGEWVLARCALHC
jgi:hypothetical protein